MASPSKRAKMSGGKIVSRSTATSRGQRGAAPGAPSRRSSAWERLHLAQTVWSPDPSKTPLTITAMAFENVDERLRAAFQTNQQLLVLTKLGSAWSQPGAASSGTLFANRLAPEGWPFTVDVGAASDSAEFRNVLILKFCDGSLDSRVDDHVRWTAATDLNVAAVAGARAALSSGRCFYQWDTGEFDKTETGVVKIIALNSDPLRSCSSGLQDTENRIPISRHMQNLPTA